MSSHSIQLNSNPKPESFVDKVIGFFIMMILLAVVAHFIGKGLERPRVFVDSMTRQCVYVESEKKNVTCNNLPKKYETIWI